MARCLVVSCLSVALALPAGNPTRAADLPRHPPPPAAVVGLSPAPFWSSFYLSLRGGVGLLQDSPSTT